jgi:hypothetical protein
MRTTAVVVAGLVFLLLVVPAGSADIGLGQAGCCQTPAACFQADEQTQRNQPGALFIQAAICVSGSCESSAGAGDADGDGVVDDRDPCADSLGGPTVVIGGQDSGVRNVALPNGCTVADRATACALTACSHGKFVACVTHLASDLVETGVLTQRERQELIVFAVSVLVRGCAGPCGDEIALGSKRLPGRCEGLTEAQLRDGIG